MTTGYGRLYWSVIVLVVVKDVIPEKMGADNR